MLKRAIAGWNAAPGAPAGWDPAKDGECGALPIRVSYDAGRVRQCESAWEPTAEEMSALAAGGSLILRVMGWQPPVALYVEPPAGWAPPVSPAAEVLGAARARLTRYLLGVALNQLQGKPALGEPPEDSVRLGADLQKVALHAGLVGFDDLHHAPRCPSNHLNKQRLPTGPCDCGAEFEAEVNGAGKVGL